MKTNNAEAKPRRRKLSRFLCQEMLYDYIMDKLDPNRRESVREYLVNDEQTREALENLREGLSCSHKLRGVAPSRPLIEQLLTAETTSKRLRKQFSFRKLPVSARLAVEAVAVSAVVGLIVTLLPWNLLQKVMFRSQTQAVEIATAQHAQSTADSPPSDSSTSKLAAKNPSQTSGSLNDVVAAKAGAQPKDQAGADSKTKNNPNVDPMARVETDGEHSPQPGSSAGRESMDQLKGFVYRGFVKIKNVDGETPQIADALKSLGGIKAGEVDLGWRRGRNSYFHFSLPENNYDSALKALKTFGVVRIYREPHRRVMPDGQIRFILWVEPTEE